MKWDRSLCTHRAPLLYLLQLPRRIIRDTEDTLFFQSTNGKVYANFADENSAGSDGGDNPKENTYLEWIASPS